MLQTVHRGIRQMKLATWNSENSFGTAHLIRGARNMSADLVVETDQLKGDDVVIDRFTKIVAAMLNIEMATLDLFAADMLMGGTLVSNADYEDWVFAEEDEVPYVTIAGRIVGSSGSGDLHMIFPKCKIAGNLTLNAQVDTFMLPGAQFEAVSEGPINGIYRLRNYKARTALEIPLRTSTGGFS